MELAQFRDRGLQKGYTLNGRLLRPAHIMVSKGRQLDAGAAAPVASGENYGLCP